MLHIIINSNKDDTHVTMYVTHCNYLQMKMVIMWWCMLHIDDIVWTQTAELTVLTNYLQRYIAIHSVNSSLCGKSTQRIGRIRAPHASRVLGVGRYYSVVSCDQYAACSSHKVNCLHYVSQYTVVGN